MIIKKMMVLALSVFVLSQISFAQTQVQDKRLTLAVFDFDLPNELATTTSLEISDGNSTSKASIKQTVQTKALTDKFITALVKSNRVKIIERSRMEELMKEQDLVISGLADPNKCIETGKLLGAQLLLLGTLNNLEAVVVEKPIPYTTKVKRTGTISLKASIRIVDAQNGQIRSAQSASIDYSVELAEGIGLQGKNVEEAEEQVVRKLTALVIDEIYPVKIVFVKDCDIYIGQGANNCVIKGSTFTVFRSGENIVDLDTGVILGSTQEEIGNIEVIRVEPKMSICKVKSLVSNEKTVQANDLCRKIDSITGETKTPAPTADVNAVFQ